MLQVEGRKLLLEDVWGARDAGADHWTERYHAYENLYYQLLNSELKTPPLEDLSKVQDVVDLVKLVKSSFIKSDTIGAALDAIEQKGFSWLNDPDERALEHCLEFATRLWLFTRPCLRNRDDRLKNAIKECFRPRSCQRQNSSVGETSYRLSEDFSARNLERRGGFRIDWTSELVEHLTCPDKKTILVFRHARTLQDYQRREVEKSIYPENLLLEVDRTIGLLFPLHKKGAEKKLRMLSKKQKADVEANLLDDEIEDFQRHQLSSYPIYQQRLLLIQQRYDNTKPSRPKQWWYDRRRRLEWAGLWIAVMVFILTLVTVATTIMQVYAAFHLR
ncbi:MAG: hypothetical protein Q9227_003789 [Pyrenula ochraceoflavens]